VTREKLIPRIIGLVAGVVLLAYLLWYPTAHDRPGTALLAKALYFGIAAMGLNLLTGYNGQVSIGHGAFFGIGAFTSAILVTDHNWPFLATLPVAAGLSFVVGLLVGFPALRVKGLYLALVTLGLAVLFPDIVKKYVDTGGQNLISVRRSKDLVAPTWWPEKFSEQQEYMFYTVLFVFLLLFGLSYLLVRSRFGRSLIAVRDHEAAAATVGINPARAKLGAFSISALYAGVAGSLSVLVFNLADATKAETFKISILFLVAVVVGGTATVIGPIIGGFLLVYAEHTITEFVGDPFTLESFFKGKEILAPAVFGITLILMMYVLPDGIAGGTKRLYRRIWRMSERRATRAAPSTPVAN
jgi:branched-chain amino acid transport system permease protein